MDKTCLIFNYVQNASNIQTKITEMSYRKLVSSLYFIHIFLTIFGTSINYKQYQKLRVHKNSKKFKNQAGGPTCQKSYLSSSSCQKAPTATSCFVVVTVTLHWG